MTYSILDVMKELMKELAQEACEEYDKFWEQYYVTHPKDFMGKESYYPSCSDEASKEFERISKRYLELEQKIEELSDEEQIIKTVLRWRQKKLVEETKETIHKNELRLYPSQRWIGEL